MYDNWEELEKSVVGCKKCKLCTGRNHIVFADGNKEADIMFIGEGPGADEDREGVPFVGKAGKLMNMAFQALEIDRSNIYIANIVKCRPPNNRNPEEDEAKACMDYLRNQVVLVKPKIIVLLRKCSIKKYSRKRIWDYSVKRKMGRTKRNLVFTNMASSSTTS